DVPPAQGGGPVGVWPANCVVASPSYGLTIVGRPGEYDGAPSSLESNVHRTGERTEHGVERLLVKRAGEAAVRERGVPDHDVRVVPARKLLGHVPERRLIERQCAVHPCERALRIDRAHRGPPNAVDAEL